MRGPAGVSLFSRTASWHAVYQTAMAASIRFAWAILSGGDPYCRYEVFKLHIADFLLRAYCKAPKNAFVGANRSISLQIGAFIGYPVERLAVG